MVQKQRSERKGRHQEHTLYIICGQITARSPVTSPPRAGSAAAGSATLPTPPLSLRNVRLACIVASAMSTLAKPHSSPTITHSGTCNNLTQNCSSARAQSDEGQEFTFQRCKTPKVPESIIPGSSRFGRSSLNRPTHAQKKSAEQYLIEGEHDVGRHAQGGVEFVERACESKRKADCSCRKDTCD